MGKRSLITAINDHSKNFFDSTFGISFKDRGFFTFPQISLVVKHLYFIKVALNLKQPNLEGKSAMSQGSIGERQIHREKLID